MTNTCVIVGNGPSLRGVSDAFLAKYPTLGCNGVFKRFDPTYYFYIDPDVDKFMCWVDDINRMRSIKYMAQDYVPHVPDSIGLKIDHRFGFSPSPGALVYGWFSSVTVMIQLAYWLNFENVLLVGFDHNYHTPGAARDTYPAEQDTSHFVDGYYPEGMTWKAPRLDLLDDWLKMSRSWFERRNRKVINLTSNSMMMAFEKGDISEW